MPGGFARVGAGEDREEFRCQICGTIAVRLERVSSGHRSDVARIEVDVASASKSGVGLDENARAKGFVEFGIRTRVDRTVCFR